MVMRPLVVHALRGAPRLSRKLALVAGLATGLAAGLVAAPAALAQDATNPTVRMLELSGSPGERPGGLSWLFGGEATLHDLVDTLHDLQDDTEMKALVIRLKDAELSATQVEELAPAIKKLRDQGKKVYVFGEAFGTTDFLLGAHADEVIGQAGGPVSMPGMHMEEMFLADTLKWAGLKADFVQVGDYKGANEQMSRSSPSPQWSENINGLLDSMYGNVRSTISTGYNLTDSQLDTAMEKLWLADMNDAKTVGMIDTSLDLPLLLKHLRDSHGKSLSWGTEVSTTVQGSGGMSAGMNPFALMSMLEQEPDTTPDGDAIAVVHIDGAIVDGDSTSGGLFGGEGSVGSRTIRNALETIRANNDFKGVVVRINSPGGSATASEVIWQGVRRVAERKPVWVSVGSMAASGGYYIAVAGDRIYVNNSSIVGSIGVVGGKISMAELYDKLKVGVTTRSRGPKADMFASAKGWDDKALAEVRTKMTQTYELFTSRVKAGRPDIDLSKTAEGRLFTGNKALELKMADQIGSLDQAIDDMADRLNLDDYGYEVMHFPAPMSLAETLQETFKSVKAPGGLAKGLAQQAGLTPLEMAGEAIRQVVGEQSWQQLRPQLEGFMQMRDGKVLLMNPRAIIVK
jgi:protease-4